MEASASYEVVTNPDPVQPELTVLFSGSSQTRPEHVAGPKVVDYYLVHFIEKGSGIFTCKGIDYELGPGDCFFIEPGALVKYAADSLDPWAYRWFAFQGTKAKPVMQQIGIDADHPIIHMGGRRSTAEHIRSIHQALDQRRHSLELRTVGLLHLLFAEWMEQLHPGKRKHTGISSKREQIVQQAVHFLTTQYAEDISIEMMAKQLGYNRAYLSKLFKDENGMPPATYLLNLRIHKARQLLRERLDLTVEQISASVGIQDALHFSKQFKRLQGMSPTAYRESIERQ